VAALPCKRGRWAGGWRRRRERYARSYQQCRRPGAIGWSTRCRAWTKRPHAKTAGNVPAVLSFKFEW